VDVDIGIVWVWKDLENSRTEQQTGFEVWRQKMALWMKSMGGNVEC